MGAPTRHAIAGQPVAGRALSGIESGDSVLSVAGEECANPTDGLFENGDPGQGHHPEVIRRGPVEACPLHHQDPLRPQQVEHEPLIVHDRVDVRVEAWEGIQGALGRDARDARDLVE